MNQIARLILVSAALGLSSSLRAVTPNNRYETIIDRNIFRLNPPPPPVAATNSEVVPDRKVDLSGISNVGGVRKAWFVVPPKAGSKDLPLYLSLSEGEAQDFLEVVSISEEEGEVKVLNAKNPMVLSLKNNSLKANPVAPMPGGGAVPPPPVANVATPPSTIPPAPAAAAPNYANATTPGAPAYGNRGVTVSGGGPTLPAATATVTEGGGLRSIPTRTLRLQPQPQQPEKQLSPEEQAANMVIQKEVLNRQGRQAPPLPFATPE